MYVSKTRSAVVIVLVTILVEFGLCSSEVSVSNSQPVRYEFPHLGLYHVHGNAPRGFETFYECELDLLPGYDADSVRPDENGNLPIDGALFITPAEFRAGMKTEQRGDINSSGEVSFVNVIRLKFVSAKLHLEGNRFAKISFVTQPVDGTSYSFDGEFLAEPRLEKGSYVELAGNLRKLKDGRKVAEANLKFLRWAYE